MSSYEAIYNGIATDGLQRAQQGGKGAVGAKSWLAALVEGLNKQIDSVGKALQEAAGRVDKDEPSTMTNFQVLAQQFSLLTNTANTVVKTIGEAQSAVARKQ
ncbi:EscF/YscF/HrpA family type III secretion system needle major subunit [Luteimonas huabeiensis]|uniref:EscF/YscF/HrpA family type III secretion system needle major subunit n=1 Tax=Luteimonas huabeiensis TaxID=1244513 RepID=UPI0004642E7D|nr:EscF/YscF/HrpA family type III secretion system needle major subunit [Luteimonas huabeiensis]